LSCADAVELARLVAGLALILRDSLEIGSEGESFQGSLDNGDLVDLRLVCFQQLRNWLVELLVEGSDHVDGLGDVGNMLFVFSEAAGGLVEVAEVLEHVVASKCFLVLLVLRSGVHFVSCLTATRWSSSGSAWMRA
jgi:hypothetical protein